MKYWVSLLFIVSTAVHAAGSGGVNAPDQRDKPHLVLISIDGFRWDYQALYDTPTMDRIAARGIRAERMIPVFPTLTFPNHYSIATGLYPANHGLIGNIFPSKDRKTSYNYRDPETVQDGSWYGGEPIWVAAERSGMVSAAYFFVGTEAPVNGIAPTYWNAFDYDIRGIDRVDQVIKWLSMPDEARPHVITLYFEDVDVATHSYAPGSEQSIAAIKRVDDYLDRLMKGIENLPIGNDVNIIIVSDHGQSAFKEDVEPFILDSVANLDGLIVDDHGTSTFLYFAKPDRARAESIRDAINENWNHGRAMLREDAPPDWRVTEEAGFAEVIIQADPGYAAFSSPDKVGGIASSHGWARGFEDMHGIFLASGPRLPKGIRIPAIEVVDVYPLMMEMLDFPITAPIDGDPELLTGFLEDRK
jgi:predicted AlkP superfamily pyrophosphatase or phosphodiesterase